jgi:transcriptional/translational regulatory protein YebC/TACO1
MPNSHFTSTNCKEKRATSKSIRTEELEAQWRHTEVANEKMGQPEKEMTVLQGARDALQVAVNLKTLEERIGRFELEWTESNKKRVDLENQIQELRGFRDALEKEREKECRAQH